MNKIAVALSKQEIKELNGNKEQIINLLVSRALYNECTEASYTEKEENEIELLTITEKTRIYLNGLLNKNIFINENDIINEYNNNKAAFENNNTPFAEARLSIKNHLESVEFSKRVEELFIKKIEEMNEDIVVTKKELMTDNSPLGLRTIITNKLLEKEINSEEFNTNYSDYLQNLDENIRLNYYVDRITKKTIVITPEDVTKEYEKNKETFKNVPEQEAKNMIYEQMFAYKLKEAKNILVNQMIVKYNIEEITNKYLDSDETK